MVFFSFPGFAYAADRYWVGGTGDWDASTTTHWSTSSGGGGGASVPTIADNVYFNSASNATAYTVTVTASVYAKDLTMANPASGVITFAGSSALSVGGSLTFASGMTNSYTGPITMTTPFVKSVSAQDSRPYGLVFSSDGTKMYMIGDVNDTIYQYSLGTTWDVSTATYASLSKRVSAQDNYPKGLAFSSDGTKMYVMGDYSVYQYTLGTAWDVSTATYASVEKSVTSQTSDPQYVVFSSDGTKMYVAGYPNSKKVYQYALGTAWDLSTAAYASISKDVWELDDWHAKGSIAFSQDGTKMYEISAGSRAVNEYTLGTAWDISTATYASLSKDVSLQDYSPYGIAFSQDGTKMYLVGGGGNVVQYALSTAWNVSTASVSSSLGTITSNGVALVSSISFDGSGGSWRLQDALSTTGTIALTSGALDTNSQSVSSYAFVASTGAKTLFLGSSTWSLTGNGATIWNWNKANSFMSGNFGTVAATYSGSTGTRTFTMSDEPNNPSLSISAGADTISISPSTYLNNLSFSGFSGTWSSSYDLSLCGNLTLGSGMTNNSTSTVTFVATSSRPATNWSYGVTFNSDGTKMYKMARDSGNVLQYSLSTPWDITTASYFTKSRTVSPWSSQVNVFFKSDGMKMFVLGGDGIVRRYSLGTAWDVSTATDDLISKAVYAEDSNPRSVSISSDGTKMYVLGVNTDTVYQYSLGTAWDVSTAIYSGTSLSSGLAFNFVMAPDGTKLYIAGYSGTITEYSLGTAWDIATTTLTASKSVSAQAANPLGMAMGSDGSNMYVSDGYNIFRYSLSSAWDVSTAFFVELPSPKSITSNGKQLKGSVIFNGSGGSWQLADAFVTTGTGLTLTKGTFDPNGVGVSMTGSGTAVVSGAFSFYDFTRIGTAVTTDAVSFDSNISVSHTLTLSGNSGTNKLAVRSSASGVQRAVTAAAVSLSDVKFRDIDADGAAIPWTGTAIIDLGNNLDITFTAIVSVYWVGGSGNWSDAANHWSASSGGAPGAGNLPASDVNVIFNSASNTIAYAVTVDSSANCRDMTIGNPASGVVTLAGSSALSVGGSLTLASGMTNNYTGSITFGSAAAGKTVTSNGAGLSSAVTFNGVGGSWQLQDAFSTTGVVTLTNGTFDTNGQSVHSSTFTTSSGTKTLTLGSSTWTLTGSGTTLWNWSTSTATMSANTATIVASYSGGTGTRTFTMGQDTDNPSLSVSAGSDTVIISSAYLNNLSFSGFSGIWSSSSGALSIYGNLMLGFGMTNNNTATLTMAATPGRRINEDSMPMAVAFSSDGTKMYVVGFSSDVIYQYDLGVAWDTTSATYGSVSKSVLAQDTSPTQVSFSSDGTKMYVLGSYTNTVYQYSLGTAWNISTALYSTSVFVEPQDTDPNGVAFSSDGTKMYMTGYTNKAVYQYSLGTAWDVSTATYAALSKSVAMEDSSPQETILSSDGSKMYMLGGNNETVYQYSLGTAWNVSTATYSSVFKYVSYQDSSPEDIVFSADGSKMYMLGSNGDTIFQYACSSNWDASSASLISVTKTITSNGRALSSAVVFNGDNGRWQLQDAFSTTGVVTLGSGTLDTNSQSVSSSAFSTAYSTVMLVPGSSTWTLTGNNATLWNWDTYYATMSPNTATIVASYSGGTGTRTFTMAQERNNPSLSVSAGSDTVIISSAYLNNLSFSGFSGTWSSSSGTLSIYGNLTLGSGMTNNNTATLTMAATSGKSVAAQDSSPFGIVFSSDGTKMYVTGSSNDRIYQYVLGTAWDVSSASYLTYKNVASQDTSPEAAAFSSDGTKMYVVGNANDTVYQYSLHIAWDVSSASYLTSKSVAAQDASPEAATFSSDGTKMYLLGGMNNTVYQYTLGTDWDVSTATYSVSESVLSQDNGTVSFAFSSDGTKMYVMGTTSDTVYQYTLGTAWDVSTATYAALSKNVASQDTGIDGTTFSSDGTKMFMAGNTPDTIYQYVLSTPWNISSAALSVASKTITSNGGPSIGNIVFDGIGGVWQLQDNFSVGTANTLTLTNGTFDDNGKDVSVGHFASSGSTSRAISKGVGTWSLTGTGTVWDMSTATNLSIVDSGTIKLTNNSTSAKAFSGGGKAFHNYWNATQGTGTVTISGSNGFFNFRSDAGRTNLFTAGTTQTLDTFTANGTAGNLIVLGSTSSSPFFFAKAGNGYILASYLSISYSTVTPAPGVWFAGTTSTNGGNNSGWSFTSSVPLTKSVQGSVKFDGKFQMR